ncbi:uncharacterized protein SCHCODRAFT_02354814 [Schizophyllum commune H4-8]|uniref:uncharacterized protein n=1 Tax=Schizophyllum commune (strain H4-8 / FGSC 9210) TaxID=578458 RepID=UPI00216104AE|nr:uncharacterized protein SCHCODRAFT_02354814 [Schizophyllum commune H4-8]KAI5890845.1 hypothetical protein SCHCODRAFT_02354814 [Schizophyllum commune H4-8]
MGGRRCRSSIAVGSAGLPTPGSATVRTMQPHRSRATCSRGGSTQYSSPPLPSSSPPSLRPSRPHPRPSPASLCEGMGCGREGRGRGRTKGRRGGGGGGGRARDDLNSRALPRRFARWRGRRAARGVACARCTRLPHAKRTAVKQYAAHAIASRRGQGVGGDAGSAGPSPSSPCEGQGASAVVGSGEEVEGGGAAPLGAGGTGVRRETAPFAIASGAEIFR